MKVYIDLFYSIKKLHFLSKCTQR